uniref:Putative ovule protein n=1 Tax=Solanum chacoense TaxID=4108 RepID=A0A0V0IAM0_SOLCH
MFHQLSSIGIYLLLDCSIRELDQYSVSRKFSQFTPQVHFFFLIRLVLHELILSQLCNNRLWSSKYLLCPILTLHDTIYMWYEFNSSNSNCLYAVWAIQDCITVNLLVLSISSKRDVPVVTCSTF